MATLPMTRAEIDTILQQAQQLDADDEDRRGILEYAGAWFGERCESKRRKIEHELRKRAKRLAYPAYV